MNFHRVERRVGASRFNPAKVGLVEAALLAKLNLA